MAACDLFCKECELHCNMKKIDIEDKCKGCLCNTCSCGCQNCSECINSEYSDGDWEDLFLGDCESYES